ncbi:branched-chain amino acid ABC transporter permease [Rubrobacter xylanophilus]|uniref:Branched-chain amino acid ABC transporter permease n=1 Tax=Rubrobacter xylanophilus TaxID=49319 RepID=A0A510HLU8_9ACTN|nr:branched-chain amino acid ABC transporter permease [Rubrobacter xylanophilus]BBL80778.1 branched-chain amino acid ABC transporter permease [Rubrobacter xylanophilus]
MIPYVEGVILTAGIFALLAQGLNLHWGFTGLLNFGHVAFFAVGAYTMGILNTQLGVPLLPSFLAAMVAATLMGIIVGLPAIRLRTDYLAIVTITIGEIFRLVLKSAPGVTELTRGPRGIRGFSNEFYFFRTDIGLGFLSPDQYLLLIVWITVAVVGVLLWVLIKSPWGRVLKGIREDEDAVRALGKNVTAYKMQSFALGAAIAGLAGVYFAMDIGSLAPDTYLPIITFQAWTIMMLGGSASHWGPIVGSIIFWAIFNGTLFIPREIISGAEAAYLRQIGIGALIMAIMIFRPQGILGSREEMILDK